MYLVKTLSIPWKISRPIDIFPRKICWIIHVNSCYVKLYFFGKNMKVILKCLLFKSGRYMV